MTSEVCWPLAGDSSYSGNHHMENRYTYAKLFQEPMKDIEDLHAGPDTMEGHLCL